MNQIENNTPIVEYDVKFEIDYSTSDLANSNKKSDLAGLENIYAGLIKGLKLFCDVSNKQEDNKFTILGQFRYEKNADEENKARSKFVYLKVIADGFGALSLDENLKQEGVVLNVSMPDDKDTNQFLSYLDEIQTETNIELTGFDPKTSDATIRVVIDQELFKVIHGQEVMDNFCEALHSFISDDFSESDDFNYCYLLLGYEKNDNNITYELSLFIGGVQEKGEDIKFIEKTNFQFEKLENKILSFQLNNKGIELVLIMSTRLESLFNYTSYVQENNQCIN